MERRATAETVMKIMVSCLLSMNYLIKASFALMLM